MNSHTLLFKNLMKIDKKLVETILPRMLQKLDLQRRFEEIFLEEKNVWEIWNFWFVVEGFGAYNREMRV